MPSTTRVGDDFRDRIASLLRTKYDNVQTEIQITAKKADILFENRDGPRRVVRVAAECRNWRRALTRDDVQKIISDYEPALKTREINDLWIICDQTPAPHAREYADGLGHCQLMTALECEQLLIDFNPLLNYLATDFENDTIAQYFILPSYEHPDDPTEKRDLHTFVAAWLDSLEKKPVAIWAGYGMGKTSYARFLAAKLAAKCKSDYGARIPILLSLGDFTSAPDLETYICTQLTNVYGVRFLSLIAFRILNAAQRFILILDGFDEMKFAMASHEFNYISSQIRSITAINPNLLMLGRPTAIQSDEEEQRLTRQKLPVQSILAKKDEAPDFTNLRLSPLTKDQYLELIRSFVAYVKDSSDHRSIDDILLDVAALDLGDILSRPVQAKMLAELVADPSTNVTAVTRFSLYEMFIRLVLNREEAKNARRQLDASKRLNFMRLLAWWLWTDKKTRTFAANEIPSGIIEKFSLEGVSPEALRRELLVGSVLEGRRVGHFLSEKTSDVFYFPHTSFTEFLVADYIMSSDFMSIDTAKLPSALDGEVPTFLKEHPSKYAISTVYKNMKAAHIAITRPCISVLLNDFSLRVDIEINGKKSIDPWDFGLLYFYLHASNAEVQAKQLAINGLSSPHVNIQFAAMYCMIYEETVNVASRGSSIARMLLHVFRTIGIDVLYTAVDRGSASVRSWELNHLVAFVTSCIEIEQRSLAVSFNFVEFTEVALKYFGMSCAVPDLIETMAKKYTVPFNDLLELEKDTEHRSDLGAFLRKANGRVTLVPCL